jgi:hypothetical protein
MPTSERSTIYLHREILVRAWPAQARLALTHHGDHANGQSLDNRRANLRWLTLAENRRHRIPRDRIPSLEAIVAQLLADLGEREDVPFDAGSYPTEARCLHRSWTSASEFGPETQDLLLSRWSLA